MRNSERHYYLIQLSIISVRREETRGEKEKYLQHYSPKHFLAFLLKRKKKSKLNDRKVLKHTKYYISRDTHYTMLSEARFRFNKVELYFSNLNEVNCYALQ